MYITLFVYLCLCVCVCVCIYSCFLFSLLVEYIIENLTLYTTCIIIAILLGIILKMARLIKDGSLRGQKSGAEFVSKAPSKILIIPGKELVQVTAKVCNFSSIFQCNLEYCVSYFKSKSAIMSFIRMLCSNQWFWRSCV